MMKNMDRRISRAGKHLFTLVILVSFIVMPFSAQAETVNSSSEMNEVFKFIENYHVSGISESKLADAAIEGMLKSLNDPYTQYFTKAEWENFENALESNYVGIGIRVGEDESGFFIAEVFDNSPAKTAGLQRGDYIISADGFVMKGKTINELVNTISGPANTEVKVLVLRGVKPLSFLIPRHKITIPTVTNKTFSEGTGYIRISTFSSDADEVFTAKLAEMQKAGLQSLIIDLRDNPGGYLDTAANIAKHFIKEGTLIHTKDRNAVDNPVILTRGTSLTIPVVVLVNGGSASASEVLTGFLQDYKLATAVGTLTYGKGSVQNVFPLSNGGALKVTIQEYLTPKKRKVNHVGLTPDVMVQNDAAQLITALQLAGMKNTKLMVDKNSLSINGVNVLDTFKTIREGNKVFANARVLSALTQSKIIWNAADKAVDVVSASSKSTFHVGSPGLKVVQGISYIELNTYQQSFPQIHWALNGEKIVLDIETR